MTPSWIKLLLHHQLRKHRVGLTIPFLIGALREPVGTVFASTADARAAIETLLLAFRDDVGEFDTVKVHTCPDLGQPVATLNQSHWNHTYESWGVPRPEGKRLSIDPPYLPPGETDIRIAADGLWGVVGDALLTGRFSFSRASKRYQVFGDDDRAFIAQALSYDEENEL